MYGDGICRVRVGEEVLKVLQPRYFDILELDLGKCFLAFEPIDKTLASGIIDAVGATLLALHEAVEPLQECVRVLFRLADRRLFLLVKLRLNDTA